MCVSLCFYVVYSMWAGEVCVCCQFATLQLNQIERCIANCQFCEWLKVNLSFTVAVSGTKQQVSHIMQISNKRNILCHR